MTAVVKSGSVNKDLFSVAFEKREYCCLVKVNHLKFAIFDTNTQLANFRLNSPGYNLIILGDVAVENAVEIHAAHTIALGSITSKTGSVQIRAQGKLVGMGVEFGGPQGAQIRARGIYSAHTQRKDEILKLFRQAIAQENPEKLALALRETVCETGNSDLVQGEATNLLTDGNEEGKK